MKIYRFELPTDYGCRCELCNTWKYEENMFNKITFDSSDEVVYMCEECMDKVKRLNNEQLKEINEFINGILGGLTWDTV